MVTISLSIVVLVLGVLLYFYVVNPKAQECGRIMFFAGLLTFLLNVSKVAELVIH
jgi:Na+/phosphate symporter